MIFAASDILGDYGPSTFTLVAMVGLVVWLVKRKDPTRPLLVDLLRRVGDRQDGIFDCCRDMAAHLAEIRELSQRLKKISHESEQLYKWHEPNEHGQDWKARPAVVALKESVDDLIRRLDG